MKDQQALFKALENNSYEGVKIRENDEGKNNRNNSILEKCPVFFSSSVALTFLPRQIYKSIKDRQLPSSFQNN